MELRIKNAEWRKKIKRILILLFLISFFSNFIFSQTSPPQQPWTLQQCIDYAIKNNIQIKQQELNTRTSRQNLLQSEALVLPNLNGSISHNFNYGRNIDPFTNTFTTSKITSENMALSSTLILFNGLQTYNSIKQNQLGFMASKYDLETAKNNLALNVASAYLQVLFSRELLSTTKQQFQISLQLVERVKQQVEVGTVSKGGLFDVEAQLASEEVTVTNAQNNVDLSFLSLVQLLNLDSAAGTFQIQTPDFNIPSESILTNTPAQIYISASKSQPQLKSAELKFRSSQKAILVAKGKISPQLSLTGSLSSLYSNLAKEPVGIPVFLGYVPTAYQTASGEVVFQPTYDYPLAQTPYDTQLKNNFGKAIGLRLTLPLFNQLQNYTNINHSKIAMENAKYNLQLEQETLHKTIQQSYADAVAGLKKYNANTKLVDALSESFKYAEQKFEVGAISSYEYNDSKNKLTKAQSDLLQSKFDYIFKIKVLDFYLGKPLTF